MSAVKHQMPVKLLSVSAMRLFFECPRAYAWKYIDKPDIQDEPSDAIVKGRTFHECVEHGSESSALQLTDLQHRAQVVGGYRRFKALQDIGAIPNLQRREVKIINEEHQFIGYADAFGVNDDNTWMMGEWKTTTYFDPVEFKMMVISDQPALYKAMIEPWAHENFLSSKDFLGLSNVKVVFPKLKRGKPTKKSPDGEAEADYMKRIEDAVQIHQQILRIDDEKIGESMQLFNYAKEQIAYLHSFGNSDRFPRNCASCKTKFGVCAFFPVCHGFDVEMDTEMEQGINTEELP